MEYKVRFLGPAVVPTGLEEKIRQAVDAQSVDSLMDLQLFFVFDDMGREWMGFSQPEDETVEVEDVFEP